MTPLLWALAVWIAAGALALLFFRRAQTSSRIAAAGVLLGATLATVPAFRALTGAAVAVYARPWPIPLGVFALRLDALSAWFLLAIVLVSALAAVYGVQYLPSIAAGKSLGWPWFLYSVLVASMALVVVAANALLFLVAWEVMALSSFLLVMFEYERDSVRQAGWIYLVATHLGTAFLLAFFLIMARQSGTMDFAGWSPAAIGGSRLADVLFVLALVGFGAKAGIMPLHVWLPEAHPAAPSHVSALMSGVMIKTGIYGLVRALTFLGPPPLWWGWVLIAAGLSSGILGVLFALAQHDLKRLLAYHSVENIGIIALGLGVALVGTSLDLPALTVLGLGGALLHVLNHAVFKTLLFLGAGSVLHATGTRDIEHLGGLSKRMPWTAATFGVGAAAICGLPPLNGFVSEVLIYLGAFHGGDGPGAAAFPCWSVIGGLALIGGLAAACFVKAFGITFLGEPRSTPAAQAHECGALMRWPMALLAALCLAGGLAAPAVLRLLVPVVTCVSGLDPATVAAPLAASGNWLGTLTAASLVLIGLTFLFALARRQLLAGREVSTAGTWDCGYARPTPRMQYTASSFAQPLTALFGALLRTGRHERAPQGLFPSGATFSSHTPDVAHQRLYAPLFRFLQGELGRVRWLQQGKVQLYILYIAVALVALLAWKLR
ncbi:MAG: proton-conducting transporter membrane subunit [Gemmatimonadota bacterium]